MMSIFALVMFSPVSRSQSCQSFPQSSKTTRQLPISCLPYARQLSCPSAARHMPASSAARQLPISLDEALQVCSG